MGTETERKFLVRSEAWRAGAAGTPYRQGYLSTEPDRTVRVRVAGERAYLTVKGSAQGISRPEYEYEIPLADAHELLDGLCLRPLIEKTRHRLEHGGLVWEVDEFAGDNQGLVVAEVELDDAQAHVALPDWVGQEVTHDPRYLNANLVKKPFSQW